MVLHNYHPRLWHCNCLALGLTDYSTCHACTKLWKRCHGRIKLLLPLRTRVCMAAQASCIARSYNTEGTPNQALHFPHLGLGCGLPTSFLQRPVKRTSSHSCLAGPWTNQTQHCNPMAKHPKAQNPPQSPKPSLFHSDPEKMP